MSNSHHHTKLKPEKYRQFIFRPMAGRLLLVGLLTLLVVATLGEARRDNSKARGYVKTTFQREVKITDKDKNRLVNETINIIIETDEEIPTHYELPMDFFLESIVDSPSGLNATTQGIPKLVGGVRKNAIMVQGTSSVLVSRGATMVHECFFDLTYCREGYTIGLWANFPNLPSEESVYLSSGGDLVDNHGIAMSLNQNGQLTFTFKVKEGLLRKFTSESSAIMPNRWFHILATWSQNKGIQLYINGLRVRGQTSEDYSSSSGSREPREFWLGRSLQSPRFLRERPFVFDDVHFWMFELADETAREIGHIDIYRLPIHDIRRMQDDRTSPKFVQLGKSEDSLEFDGQTTFFSDDMKHHCHTNVTSCFNGFLLSGWIKFGPFKNGGHYVSTGDYGLKLYYKDKILVGEALFDDHFWNVTWKRGVEGQWYFVELSMSPDENIVLYIDQYPVSTARSPRDRSPPNDFADSNIEFGRRSQNVGHAAFSLDDLELWSADRNMLEVLGYIVRGRPIRYHVPMDYVVDNRIPHQNLSISVINRPIVVKGKVRDAIDLNGKGQYIRVDTRQGHVQPCLYNLNFCKAGATISMWIKPGELLDGMEYFSTGTYGFKMWQEGGRTEASARVSDREWTLVYRGQQTLARDKWQLVELTFDPHSRGGKLKMYIDGKLEGESDVEGRHREREESSGDVFIGRGDGTRPNSVYGAFTIDEFEYWFAKRDYLTRFNFIKRGQLSDHIHLTMDNMKDNKVIHHFLDVSTQGAPQLVGGRVGNALNFNGIGQYLDLGGHRDNCFGDLALCQDGMTGSMWTRFNSLPDHGYLFSNGGGLQVYTAEGNKLFVVVDIGGKKWTVVVPGLTAGKWYFVEYTWHPNSGLKVFINNRPVGFCSAYQPSTKGFTSRSGRVLIGAANPGEPDNGRVAHNADAMVDEFEYWFLDRDSLIGSKSIIRDAIAYIHFPFEIQDGSRVYHPDFNIYLHNGATITQGRVGNGLALVPRSYASFQDQSRICMGNIALCPNGLTISMLIKPSGEVGKILTSGSYSVSLVGDELQVKFINGTNVWSVNTRNALALNSWQQFDLSWHPEKGVEVWVDDRKVASKETPEHLGHLEAQNYEVYLGWPSEVGGRQTGNLTVDELQFWYASRDQLDLDPIINRIILDMDIISNNRLVNPYQVIRVLNNAITVPALNLTGVQLLGNGQYLESSDNMLVCRGNLEDCQQGFTARFKLKPNEILDNQYLLSSSPIDVYLRNRRLIAELRTSYRIWKVTSDELSPDTWYQVDLSWSPVEGASLHVNGEKVSSTVGEANPGGQHTFNTWRKFYIGRANTNMFNEKYANAVFDDVQFWEARRDLLIRKGLITSERTSPPHPWGVITPSPTFVFPSIYPGSNRRLIFDGRTWYLYDLGHLPPEFLGVNREEKLKINFLTTHPDGLLWFNGDPSNNVHILIKDGQLYFVVTRDGKITRTPIGRPPMNDNQWHEIFVSRNDKQVDILVDGQDHTFNIDFPINFFKPGMTYVGGSGQTWNLTQHFITSNFDGKIREIWHHGETFPKDFDYKGLIFVKPHPSFMNLSGSWIDERDDYVGLQHPKPILINILEGDEKVKPKQDVPITVDGNSFLSISGIRPSAPQEGGVPSYEMKFRTAHPNGILAFLSHQSHPFNSALVELYDGVPYLVADFGRGYQRLRFGNQPMRVDDDREHYIKMMSSGDWLKFKLDDETSTHHLVLGRNRSLDIFSQRDKILHLGGTQEDLPWHSWNRLSREFFKGCIWGVRFNSGETLDLVKALGRNRGGVQQQCIPSMEYCSHRPCRHGGICTEIPNGYRCDCSNTQYTGRNCEMNAEFAQFGDRDRLELTFTPTKVTHTNDISLRFRTPKENVHLFSATNYRNDDILKVSLDGGIGRVESRFGNAKNSMFESFKCHQPLSDNQWHTVHVKRRANYLEVYVDDCEKVTFNYPGENYDFLIDRIILGRDEDKSFVGHLQNFFIDGVDVFPRITTRDDTMNIITTVKTTETEKVVPFNPITIRENSNAFLYLDPLQFLGDTNITFMFRTKDPNVLLMYNSGHEDDFFAVELVNGKLHVAANDGTDVKEVTSSAGRLDDNNWHEVAIEQKPNNRYDIIVDQRYRDSLQFMPSRHTLDLKDRLYIGNVPNEFKDRLPNAVKSRNGFSGCFASLVINRIFYQMDNDQYLTPFITAGCSNATGYCVPGICSYGGVCHEKQDGFWCDCNMTSYDGVRCRDEAKGLIFSMRGGKGIAIMRLEPPTSTSSDRIALMFMTHESNGTLLRADGRIGDFIELKLVNGHVVAVYRVGDKIHEIVERRRSFNDGHAHRVVFMREGENAHISVDDYPKNSVDIGRRNVLFDEMSIVKVGGDLDRTNEIINHFDGIISGVNINGWRVIEHSEARTRGDVYDATRPFYVERHYTIVTPKPTLPPILPPDIVPPVIIHPPGPVGGGEGISWGEEGVIVPEGGAVFEPIIGEAVVPGDVGGARAAGAAGAMIGALLLASSAMWALYKFKPGLLGGPKASVPSQSAPLLGGNGDSVVVPADLRDHFPASSVRTTGGAGGVDGVDGGVVFSSGGGTIQGYHISGSTNAPAGFQTMRSTASELRHDSTLQGLQEPLNQSITYSYERSQVLTQQGANPSLLPSSGQFGTGQFSMRNVDLSYGGFNQQEIFTQQQQQRMMQQQQQIMGANSTLGHSLGQGQRSFMTAEEIRVDCVQMTNNGRYVVTGSNCGPPQVWDLKSGELVKVMRGEELSSTDLHLANGDTLLVGQVAELEPFDLNETSSSNKVHHRRLQIWDFETGKPLDMSRSETCTASCMMSDGEKIVLGRTEKFGGGTSIIIWDILNNEPIRHIKCDASVGFADHISYLNVSKDNRYILAGFQNSYDNTANYVTFDLASADAGGMRVASLDALVDVTTLLNDKEAVTGTRRGEMVVWSLKTGRQVRSIGGPGLLAHQGEIKEVVVSRDGQLLVSASADGTLKVWDAESENLMHTLIGHRDEVWCATISPDNELVGSGSRDGTIRLWKVSDGTSVAAIDAGMTIFKVLLSNNKKTVVALGDKGGARKLIMLRVVRSTATIDRRTFNP